MTDAQQRFAHDLEGLKVQMLRTEALYHDCRYQARRAILRAKVARAEGRGLRARRWTRSAQDWHALSLEVPRDVFTYRAARRV